MGCGASVQSDGYTVVEVNFGGNLPVGKAKLDPAPAGAKAGPVKMKSFLNAEGLASVANSAASDTKLTVASRDALEDFEKTCRILGCDGLDETKFRDFLRLIGYTGDKVHTFDEKAKIIFNDTVELISKVSGKRVTKITSAAMQDLYSSAPYREVDDDANTGSALISYVGEVFDQFDKDGSGELDTSEIVDLLKSMLGEDDAQELLGGTFDPESFVQKLDTNGDKTISKKELCAGLLKFSSTGQYHRPLPRDFNVANLDPAITSNAKFVEILSKWSTSHDALRHHFTHNLRTGGFGERAKSLVLQYLTSYQRFSSKFSEYISAVLAKLEDPKHREIFTENLDEEQGKYDAETVAEIKAMGLDAEKLVGVTHKDLYARTLAALAARFGDEHACKDQAVTEAIAAPLVAAFDRCVVNPGTSSTASAAAAMYFGSEFCVPTMYRPINEGLRLMDPSLTEDDLAFFTLHIDMDEDHAKKMSSVLTDLAGTRSSRVEMLEATRDALEARVKLFENVVQMSNPAVDAKATMSSDKLYDAQSGNWKRSKPTCLSDYTGRPVVFDLCQPFVDGARVLDVGCGEGYVARKLIEQGAETVVGVDISPGMIEAANKNKIAGEREQYLVGDCSSIHRVLSENPDAMRVMPGADFETGCFNLAVGVFVFNYVTIAEMKRTMEDVHRLLKPGGSFVFSVPHPFMLLAHGQKVGTEDDQADKTFSFRVPDGENLSDSYFSLRDRQFGGVIRTTEGKGLNVKMTFKTVEDYTKSLAEAGFEVDVCHEARVMPEHVRENPAFFESVKDVPLHIVFRARKPAGGSTDLGSTGVLDLLPKKIMWNKLATENVEQSMIMRLPADAHEELARVVLRCFDQGVGADDFEMNVHAKTEELAAVARHAAAVRRRLLVDVGAILVRGLDPKRYGGNDMSNIDKWTHCSRLAYYIYSSLMGQVDAGARGRLFDVKNAHMDVKADNVLFSVSNAEAGWHTDGASRDRVYDIVSLLCITPASSGGEFKIANGCNALENLKMMLPNFLMHELTRPLPRDVLENGAGKGASGLMMKLSRSRHLLAMRIKHNSYPIFVDKGDRMRFRYMRFWIETAHKKVGWPISPMLTVAMDMLDKQLDESCCFEQCMESGDMIYDNNMIVAHARNAFEDLPGKPPRHKVRAWLQIQKAELAAAGVLD